LAPLTRALYGFELPKQFATFDGRGTLLQETMERIAPIVPPNRTLVVIADRYEELARHQLVAFPGVEIVTQPSDAGTAPGLLLPLARILACKPNARVVVFPSDHLFERAGRFVDAVTRAIVAADSVPRGVALVGAVADRPATDLGWILAGNAHDQRAAGARVVDRFVEKPSMAVALHLLRLGGWWNTLIVAARGAALWDLFARTLPEVFPRFDRYRRALRRRAEDPTRYGETYAGLSPRDISRDVFERAHGLVAVGMPADAGWSDCGTPERLIRTLRRAARLTEAQAQRLVRAASVPTSDRRDGERAGTTSIRILGWA
jgi:mannose-1-phosphate guanylyltransferase